MPKTILWLRPEPVTLDQWLINNPACVHYACQEINDEKKIDKHNFDGKIQINIYSQHEYLFLEISDNGIGVPPEKLKTIFDPFFTLKKIRQGTGLGLAVCYRIVEQHGGKIYANLNEKEGMTFTIMFNLKDEKLLLDGK